MSSHPYGLRGDPFASPATLSAKDASRLIRRRVRAFNGDGGALFPIDTCDLIHELAGGIPDAMLELAGAAMRIAAAEAAAAVSPAHVRSAHGARCAAPTGADAGAPVVAESAGEAEAGTADAAVDPPDARADSDAAIPTEAGDPGRLVAAETWDDAPAIADDDPDLPVFRPAAFALPSQPSENLDRDARDWVSRFIPAPGAGHAPASPPREPHPGATEATLSAAPAPRVPSPSRPVPAPADAANAPSPARAFPQPRSRGRGRAPRRRRRSGSQGLLIGVAALCVIAVVVRLSLRGNLAPPATGTARPVATASPATEAQTPGPEPVGGASERAAPEPAPAVDRAPETPARDDPGQDQSPIAPRVIVPTPAPAPPATPAATAPARRDGPAGRFGLEVATFIFEERARVERERLAANGLRARLVTTLEYGSRVYRVVVGGYRDPAAAERAADSLLSNGVVLQARVVRIP